MRSVDLTPAEAARLTEKNRPMLGYMSRLEARMVNRRFHHDDPLLRAVVKVYDAMHALNVEVHYLSCESGVGRLRKDSDPNDK
jgi:hypothetical protein